MDSKNTELYTIFNQIMLNLEEIDELELVNFLFNRKSLLKNIHIIVIVRQLTLTWSYNCMEYTGFSEYKNTSKTKSNVTDSTAETIETIVFCMKSISSDFEHVYINDQMETL